jgi:hypothetical protein
MAMKGNRMQHRYFFIVPYYTDEDTFCRVIIGSEEVRVVQDIYVDMAMLQNVASALEANFLSEEYPVGLSFAACASSDGKEPEVETAEWGVFNFFVSVLPHEGKERVIRFRVFNDNVEVHCGNRVEIRFPLSPEEALDLANSLKKWCENPETQLEWIGGDSFL